ncbi:MAG TPA: hypothetical protein VE844_15805 [Gammaproteobacteria bacterium]|nr:hypothetical protein [Gammaproteobacteria bacterium]
MRKSIKESKGLTPLPAPVPPILAQAIGYTGGARFVAFNWTPYGDKAEYFDGRRSATGNWQAFLAYIQHPVVSPLLEEYDLGSSESEAKHCLVLDREKLELFIASVKEARVFLTEQWPPDPPLRMSQDEYVAKVSEILRHVKPPDTMDIEEVQRRIDEQYALIEQMQQWLDRHLKN